jgi:hypothetical protein
MSRGFHLSNAATIIAVILFSDKDLNRALTLTAVVVGGLLRVANIHVVQFERLAGAHLFEWVFLLDPDFVDQSSPLLLFHTRCLCEIERLKRDVKKRNAATSQAVAACCASGQTMAKRRNVSNYTDVVRDYTDVQCCSRLWMRTFWTIK